MNFNERLLEGYTVTEIPYVKVLLFAIFEGINTAILVQSSTNQYLQTLVQSGHVILNEEGKLQLSQPL